MTTVSTLLGALKVRQKAEMYDLTVAALKEVGKQDIPPAPSLNPLGVSKDFVQYLSMTGGLMAILIGWYAVAGERRNGTLRLLLSRPVSRDQFVNGKIAGVAASLLLITVLTGLLVLTVISIAGKVSLTAMEIKKAVLFFCGSWFFLLVFASVSFYLSVVMTDQNKALFLSVIIWMVFAFILPQIGDTMDLDNQIPGGFFSYLGLTKAEETKILTKFRWYELVRDGIEELSPTKHFERLSYALLGVKPGFEDLSAFEVFRMKWIDVALMLSPALLFVVLSSISFQRRERID